MVKEYDQVYHTQLNKYIRQNLLYRLLFFPKKITVPSPYPRRLVEAEEIPSFIFPAYNLFYDLEYTTEETAGILLNLQGRNSRQGPEDKFRESYQQNYSQLLEAPFLFDFTLEGKYHYDSGGVLQQARVYLKEQMSRQLSYISEYEFIKEENN